VEFRTRRETIGGDVYSLRELSGAAVEAAQEQSSAARQGYALIALSLLDGTGAPMFVIDRVDAGVAHVMSLPARISQGLTAAVEALNATDLDDARKN